MEGSFSDEDLWYRSRRAPSYEQEEPQTLFGPSRGSNHGSAATNPGYFFGARDESQAEYRSRLMEKWLGLDTSTFRNQKAERHTSGPPVWVPDGEITDAIHIDVVSGREDNAIRLAESNPRLLAKENANRDTPLHLAAAAGYEKAVQCFIKIVKEFQQPQHRRDQVQGTDPVEEPSEEAQDDEGLSMVGLLMKVDRNGGTPLHEAMRHGHESTALLLVEAQPDASMVVDALGYSVLYLAVLKGSEEMVRRLLEIENSSHAGPQGTTAMHAAVLVDNLNIGRDLLEKRPGLCWSEVVNSPLHNATFTNNLEMVKLIMDIDKSAVFYKGRSGDTAVHAAAMKGHLNILMEFLQQCPDSVFCLNNSHQNILVMAVLHQQFEVIKYVLRTPNLRSLINQPDISGNTPLHWAAFKAKPTLLRLLLANDRVDKLARNMHGQSAMDIFYTEVERNATIDWKETMMILDEAVGGPSEIRKEAKKRIKELKKKQLQSMTQRYITNMTFASGLVATVTFAAALTVPGGFISESGNADRGSPLLIHNLAFKVFVISDTVALFASLAVTLLCINASWDELKYLLLYRTTTRALMWCALCATTVAFATGMYAVLAPRLPWLAILVCVISFILLGFTFFLAKLPKLMMRFRLGKLLLKDYFIMNL